MNIQLSDHFTYKKLLRFTLPSIVMMVFTSIYGVVDGFFISNFVGKTPFAAVNFIFPVLMIMGALGSMFGSGGSALIAKTLGEGDKEKANRIFSMLVYLTAATGVAIAVAGIVFIRPIARTLGAEGPMLEDCVTYSRIILPMLPALMLQFEFQSFFITAEKPQLGLYVTVAAGVANMVLDALLVAVLPFGLKGAAWATAISQLSGGLIPVIYFSRRNTSLLKLGRWHFDARALLKTAGNGSSEFLTNISMSVVSMLYNIQLMKYAGENGVAAYGTLMYVSMIFISVFLGYAVGTAPVVGYHFGAKDYPELKSLLRKSLMIVSILSAGMLIASLLLAKPLSVMYVGYDPELLALTLRGFYIFSFSFLFAGFPIYGSSFFTALNDGLVSALISSLRTVVFQTASVLLLPLVWGIDGIWASLVTAEVAATVVAVFFWLGNRDRYYY